jgi:conjugal transfer ATP-binding protein TraC
LQLSAHGFELLKSLKTLKGQYAELLIKNPRGLQLARLCLDPFTQTLYATTAETYSAIQRLIEEGLPLMEAVKQVSQRGGQ